MSLGIIKLLLSMIIAAKNDLDCSLAGALPNLKLEVNTEIEHSINIRQWF